MKIENTELQYSSNNSARVAKIHKLILLNITTIIRSLVREILCKKARKTRLDVTRKKAEEKAQGITTETDTYTQIPIQKKITTFYNKSSERKQLNGSTLIQLH